MRNIILLLGLLVANKLAAQGEFNLNDTVAFVRVTLREPSTKGPYEGEFEARGQKYGFIGKGKTDAKGQARIQLRNDDSYTFHVGKHACKPTISLTPVPYVTYDYAAYTYPHVFLTVIFVNPDKQPVMSERITIRNKATGELVLQDTTKADGKLALVLPDEIFMVEAEGFGGSYEASSSGRAESERTNVNITFTDWGWRERERRKQQADSLMRERERRLVIYYDSLILTKTELKDLEDTYLPYELEEFVLQTFLLQKAKLYQTKIKENPNIYVDNEQHIMAALERINKREKNLMAVFQGSYTAWNAAQELLIWQQLHPQSCINRLMFALDTEPIKAWVSSGKLSLNSGLALIEKTKAAKNYFNYLNASQHTVATLLEAQRQTSKTNEGILFIPTASSLLTDNDLRGLEKLKRPVRILVPDIRLRRSVKACCGRMVDIGSGLDVQLLNIAYRTKGSIHSIHEDWWDIGQTKEGEIRTFAQEKYQLSKGKFRLIK